MSRSMVVTLALISLCGACSSTHQLDIRDDAGMAEFNREHADRGGEVCLVGGGIHQARWIKIDPDSTTWKPDGHGAELRRVANRDVAEVRYRNHGRGAVDGLGVGVLAGMATFALLGAATYADESNSIPSMDGPGDGAAVGAVVGAAVGALLGSPIGAAAGHADKYLLVNTDPPLALIPPAPDYSEPKRRTP